jgi:GNAT superfamily N-acetyltransferase
VVFVLEQGVVAYDLAERPDLAEPALELGGVGADFLRHDLAGQIASLARFRRIWPTHSIVLVRAGEVVARACTVPIRLGGGDREELPAHGWDAALIWGVLDHLDGAPVNAACAIDIHVDPELRGLGLAGMAVTALRRMTAQLSLAELIVPVRPPGKAAEPFAEMAEYALRCRPQDGLPVDWWLRVHVRAGGRIDSVAPFAMTVTAPLEQWRRWTGEAFDRPGPVAVAGGLAPVICDTGRGIGVYLEPNVWVRHRCR